jgi:hypothetical protein
MTKHFNPEFREEVAELVVDKGYSVREAADAMSVGKLLSCLGNEDSVDIKYILRRYPSDNVRLNQAILNSLTKKPERHHFEMDAKPNIVRFMNSTGGVGNNMGI